MGLQNGSDLVAFVIDDSDISEHRGSSENLKSYSFSSMSSSSSSEANTSTNVTPSSLITSASNSGASNTATPSKLMPAVKGKHETPNKRFWGQEVNPDSIYHIYLKKITYSTHDIPFDSSAGLNESFNSTTSKSSETEIGESRKESKKKSKDKDSNKPSGPEDKHLSDPKYGKCGTILSSSSSTLIGQGSCSILNTKEIIEFNDGDKKYRVSNGSPYNTKPEIQCLQWETRQIRILRAATMDHLIQYILLITSQQRVNCINLPQSVSEPLMEEERSDVLHMMHVLFCTYRVFLTPVELFATFLNYYQHASASQMRIVFHYWLKEYPEDFFTRIGRESRDLKRKLKKSVKENQSLIDLLIACPFMDDVLYKKAYDALKLLKARLSEIDCGELVGPRSPSNSIISLEPKFIAQQLTAVDLENFRSLKAYTLLLGPKRNKHVQNMIKNFNLLSKHVIVTILKSYTPETYTAHWINTAYHLRKMKNFNSLKAVIAGLTNESIYRLKQTVWNKLSKSTLATFESLSKIVDDVDNQTLLRQTQLEIEGTAKCSIVDESFGTIPYLGTFLTDLTVIDSKMSNYVNSPNGNRLINLEKCSEQFEIITQINLLQKNIYASLDAYQRCQEVLGVDGCMPQLPTRSVQVAPKVTRLFRTWFQDSAIQDITENQCYQLSLGWEPPASQRK